MSERRDFMKYLGRLVPLCELPQDNLRELANKISVMSIKRGKILFRTGSENSESYYLIKGRIALHDGSNKQLISHGTASARFPIDHSRPRKSTAIAESDVQYIAIDNNYLDLLLTWGQNSASYAVNEIEEQNGELENDWMSQLLSTEIFHRIPATNIQAVMMKMEEFPVQKEQIIIKQGEEGDYYYHIRQGRCLVQHTTKSGKRIKLAELETGQGFGEEALISKALRNASVIMLTDGQLMRLKKSDFQLLLSEPILTRVNATEARKMVADGAQWLDVRLESEFQHAALPGSLNIPLYLLRFKVEQLDSSHEYVVYCDTGRRSSSAAFILSERGFNVAILNKGYMGQKVDLLP